MFAKLAALTGGRRRHEAALAPAHSNIPRHDWPRPVTPQRPGRYRLVCRWVAAPATGKLECRWHIEPVAGSSAEAPGPMRGKDDTRRQRAVRLRGKRTRPPRAA
jgi:hypothetical protein